MNGSLSIDKRRDLLHLARESIAARLTGEPTPALTTKDPLLAEKRGAFVTPNPPGELRGCIGYPFPLKPLADAVVEMAAAAAFEDPRFEPVTAEEMDDIHIEISVLTLPVPAEKPEDVVVGRHGIIVSQGGRKGLLLPPGPGGVRVEAGNVSQPRLFEGRASPDAWKKGARIEIFEAEVFDE